MRPHRIVVAVAITLACQFADATRSASGADAPVRFDLPPVAPAIADSDQAALVTVELRLSSMIESAELPQIDQWIVRCLPRDDSVSIADYWPRTETASDVASHIQVKETKEESKAFGVSLDAGYAHLANGSAAADHAKKNLSTRQFDQLAPQQAVTASGTIHRGRGVYFELRWTTQQVLEGEKTFRLTFAVPETWRGSLIDVSVVAQSNQKSFASWDRETKTIAAAEFVVAAYRQGDATAATRAQALAEAEYELHSVAAQHRVRRESSSLPSMLRRFAFKLDSDKDHANEDWLRRLLLERADPHLDKSIRKLPMPVRVAVLDYADIRDEFNVLNQNL